MPTNASWFLATVVAAAFALSACSKGESTDVANGGAGTIVAAKRAIATVRDAAPPATASVNAADTEAAAEVAKGAAGATVQNAADAAGAATGSAKNRNQGAVHNKW
jgi:hypothetical protein